MPSPPPNGLVHSPWRRVAVPLLAIATWAAPASPPATAPATPPATAPAALVSLPADEAAERALLVVLGPGFRVLHTAHFSIISSAAADRPARLATIAEDTFDAVCRFANELRMPVRRPAHKMTVVFFGDWDAYALHARRAGFHVDESIPGFYDERSHRCILFDYANAALIREKRRRIRAARSQLTGAAARGNPRDADAPADREKTLQRIAEIERRIAEHERLISRTVIRHEIAHQVLHHLGFQSRGGLQRRWLTEGLAMQFESPEPVNKHRLADFLTLGKRQRPTQLRELIADPTLIGPGAEQMQEAYAAAWALVYYLVHEHPQAFARYVRTPPPPDSGRSSVRPPAVAAFERAFGPIDAAFEATWHRTIAGLGAAHE